MQSHDELLQAQIHWIKMDHIRQYLCIMLFYSETLYIYIEQLYWNQNPQALISEFGISMVLI